VFVAHSRNPKAVSHLIWFKRFMEIGILGYALTLVGIILTLTTSMHSAVVFVPLSIGFVSLMAGAGFMFRIPSRGSDIVKVCDPALKAYRCLRRASIPVSTDDLIDLQYEIDRGIAAAIIDWRCEITERSND
jgi:hypothetical protein